MVPGVYGHVGGLEPRAMASFESCEVIHQALESLSEVLMEMEMVRQGVRVFV
jgi:hypothetical protein